MEELKAFTYTLITYSHSPNRKINKIEKGKDNKLFSNTIETSLRDPDLVNCLALSMTSRSVSCHKEYILHDNGY